MPGIGGITGTGGTGNSLRASVSLDALAWKFQKGDAAGARPQPVHKELRASLDGKEAACGKLAERAALRAARQNTDRVALTDGAEALQAQMLRQVLER